MIGFLKSSSSFHSSVLHTECRPLHRVKRDYNIHNEIAYPKALLHALVQTIFTPLHHERLKSLSVCCMDMVFMSSCTYLGKEELEMAIKVWSMEEIRDECARKASVAPLTLVFPVLLSTRRTEINEMVAALANQLSNSNGRAKVTHTLYKAKRGVPYKELELSVVKPAPVMLQPERQPAPDRARKDIWERPYAEFSAWLKGSPLDTDDSYT